MAKPLDQWWEPQSSVARIRAKGQLTIPAWVRRRLGIEAGDVLSVRYDELEGVIVMRKRADELREEKHGE